MKLLLLALCLLNILIGAGGWYLHQHIEAAPLPETLPEVRLQLLSEMRAGSVRVRPAAADAPVAGSQQTRLTCELVGPFASRLDADKRRSDMETLADLSIDTIVERPAVDYWVMIEPLGSLADARALAEQITDKGLDTYVLTQGNYANGISLGLFSRPGRAEKLKKQVQDAGFNPMLVQVERDRMEYWLRLVWAEGMSSEALRLSELAAGGNRLRRERADCL